MFVPSEDMVQIFERFLIGVDSRGYLGAVVPQRTDGNLIYKMHAAFFVEQTEVEVHINSINE